MLHECGKTITCIISRRKYLKCSYIFTDNTIVIPGTAASKVPGGNAQRQGRFSNFLHEPKMGGWFKKNDYHNNWAAGESALEVEYHQKTIMKITKKIIMLII